jgi:hypothetical protein
MKNKYNIDESVYDYNSNKIRVIKDLECFGELVLYYFSDKDALPEHKILPSKFMGLKTIVSTPQKEKVVQITNVLSLIDKELDTLLK